MLKEICIKIIPHERQRYETCGDYWYDKDGILQVRVSDMGNEIFHKMILIHELVEEAITKHNGIPEEKITDFDMYYEERRKLGLVGESSEPGFDENAPYKLAHAYATSVELGICAMTGINFPDYDKTVNEL